MVNSLQAENKQVKVRSGIAASDSTMLLRTLVACVVLAVTEETVVYPM